MRTLFIYAGERRYKIEKINTNVLPDSDLYGFNYMDQYNVHATYKDFEDIVSSSFLRRIIGFRFGHMLRYFYSYGEDIVFGPTLLYMMFFRKIFRNKKTKFVLLNISIGRTIMIYKKRHMMWLLRFLFKEIDHCVSLSKFQDEFLVKHIPETAGKTSVIHLGVDVGYFSQKTAERNGPILSVGKDNGRDYKTLFEVALLLPEEKFEIVCHPRNIPKDIAVPSNVSVSYMVSMESLREKYASSKMLLLITHDDNYEDGADCSGQTVLLDAMASGMPIIASRKSYILEYIVEGKDALLVDFYAPQQIVNAILLLKGDNERSSELGYNAQRSAEENFSTKHMARDLVSLWDKIK